MMSHQSALYFAQQAYWLRSRNGIRKPELQSVESGYKFESKCGRIIVLKNNGALNATETKTANAKKGIETCKFAASIVKKNLIRMLMMSDGQPTHIEVR